jgi:hypothetical protein
LLTSANAITDCSGSICSDFGHVTIYFNRAHNVIIVIIIIRMHIRTIDEQLQMLIKKKPSALRHDLW